MKNRMYIYIHRHKVQTLQINITPDEKAHSLLVRPCSLTALIGASLLRMHYEQAMRIGVPRGRDPRLACVLLNNNYFFCMWVQLAAFVPLTTEVLGPIPLTVKRGSINTLFLGEGVDLPDLRLRHVLTKEHFSMLTSRFLAFVFSLKTLFVRTLLISICHHQKARTRFLSFLSTKMESGNTGTKG